MAETTYLRYIRQKCGITLMELEEHSSFSNQYLSLLELGRGKLYAQKCGNAGPVPCWISFSPVQRS